MLRTSQIFHENPNHAYSYRVDCGNYHIAESSPEPLSMARVLQILSQSKSGITTAHPFFTLSFGEVALFQFAESKPVTSRAANPWIPNVEHPSKLLLAVRSGASAVVRYPLPMSFALSQQVTKDFLWQLSEPSVQASRLLPSLRLTHKVTTEQSGTGSVPQSWSHLGTGEWWTPSWWWGCRCVQSKGRQRAGTSVRNTGTGQAPTAYRHQREQALHTPFQHFLFKPCRWATPRVL